MDTETVLKIIEMLNATKSFATKEYQEGFECETNREYTAYVNGQCDALNGVINQFQKYMHSLQNQVENEMNRGE